MAKDTGSRLLTPRAVFVAVMEVAILKSGVAFRGFIGGLNYVTFRRE